MGLRRTVLLFFVAFLVESTADVIATASQPLIQVPRLFTSAVQKRDLKGKESDGAVIEVEQNDAFDHVGQKFVRKALDVLDQRLLKAAEAKRKDINDADEEEDDDDEDNIMEGEGFNDDNEDEKHHDFAKIDEDDEQQLAPKAKENRKSAHDLYDEEEIQAPVKRKQNKNKARRVNRMEDDYDQLPQKAQRQRPAQTRPLIPVDLNVNEGVEDDIGRNPLIDSLGTYLATKFEEAEQSYAFAAPNIGIVGSAAAGVGVMGSAAYCCVSRRRSRKRHTRSELPMYEPESPPHSSGTPDGYRVRRGLTKYR